MTCRKALQWWETKVGNCEVTPQALSPIAKSLLKRYGPKVPTTLHGSLGITYHTNEKAMIVDVQKTGSHLMTCEMIIMSNRWRVESKLYLYLQMTPCWEK
jgi:hypothetical protein